MRMPDDLVPIPTQPWDKRPDSLPLDVEECRTALWMFNGNITKAAQHLKIPPARFRSFVKKSPRLTREMEESRERMLDKADENIWDALESEDDARRDSMAKFVYQTFGKVRGFGSGAGVNVNVNNPTGPIMLGWDTGQNIAQIGPTIEGEVNDD